MNKREIKQMIRLHEEGVGNEVIFNVIIDLHQLKSTAELAKSLDAYVTQVMKIFHDRIIELEEVYECRYEGSDYRMGEEESGSGEEDGPAEETHSEGT